MTNKATLWFFDVCFLSGLKASLELRKNLDGGFDKGNPLRGWTSSPLMEDLIQGWTDNKTSHRLNPLITMTSNDSAPTGRLRLTFHSKSSSTTATSRHTAVLLPFFLPLIMSERLFTCSDLQLLTSIWISRGHFPLLHCLLQSQSAWI